ncbi:putative nicotinate-nucleotide adenylyltransferase [Clostridia bacterium]|nr:putative nicotinate-nucleotide adenylyltransferase [Clostridia bacterium]
MKRKSTALYGGTFNPPHLGHFEALSAISQLYYQVIVMPSGTPPHKPLPDGSANPEQRLEMARLMAEGLENVEISDFEIRKDGASYTVDTLEWLTRRHPRITLVVGADMLFTLPQWKDFGRIARLADFAAVCRSKEQRTAVEAAAQTLGAEVIEHEPVDISSTRLRELLARSQGREWLRESVWEFIKENGLYGFGAAD